MANLEQELPSNLSQASPQQVPSPLFSVSAVLDM